MAKKTLIMSDSDIEFLIKIKNYFGENDKTQFQHSAFYFLKKFIDSINVDSDTCKNGCQAKKIPSSDFCGSCLEKLYGRDPI